MTTITESVVEEATLAWLEDIGWQVVRGPDTAPDTLDAERADYSEVVQERRRHDALARLNPELPSDALDDAFRKLTRPEGPTLEARNRAFHRSLVDGVTVEHRLADGTIRGAQAQAIDFVDPTNNDFLAVNQFTLTEDKNTRRPRPAPRAGPSRPAQARLPARQAGEGDAHRAGPSGGAVRRLGPGSLTTDHQSRKSCRPGRLPVALDPTPDTCGPDWDGLT